MVDEHQCVVVAQASRPLRRHHLHIPSRFQNSKRSLSTWRVLDSDGPFRLRFGCLALALQLVLLGLGLMFSACVPVSFRAMNKLFGAEQVRLVFGDKSINVHSVVTNIYQSNVYNIACPVYITRLRCTRVIARSRLQTRLRLTRGRCMLCGHHCLLAHPINCGAKSGSVPESRKWCSREQRLQKQLMSTSRTEWRSPRENSRLRRSYGASWRRSQ